MTLLLSSSSRSLCSVFRTRTLLARFCGTVWLPAKRRAIPVTTMNMITTRRRRFTSALYAESKASFMTVGETRQLRSKSASLCNGDFAPNNGVGWIKGPYHGVPE